METRQRKRNADWAALHGLVFFALVAGAMLTPALRVWPLLWVVPLAAYGLVVAIVPGLRATFRGWRFGRVSAAGAAGALVLGGGACVVLLMFDRWVRPDVSGYAEFLPVHVLGGVVICGVLFPVLNAFLEEVIFRGIMWDAIEAQWGGWVAGGATALLFGYGHLRGYPPGAMGAVLAGVFALGLGGLRAITDGLGWPVLAHIVADATIYGILARSGVFGQAH